MKQRRSTPAAPKAPPPADIPAYIASLVPDLRPVAEALRGTIMAALPGVKETIRYGMPAFQSQGRTVLYMAVWRAHAALYPIYRGSEDFERLVGPYRSAKDTVGLPIAQPMPHDLVALIAQRQQARIVSG